MSTIRSASTATEAARPAIDLVVIGGYLGAGKTTLLNHVLTQRHARKVAVLVNDFGDVNIDARLIRAQTDDVIELENGCICCSIGGALVDALTRIEARSPRPDVLLIEASGVSDPQKIAQIGLLNRGFALSAVLVLVDAASIDATLADPYVGDMARRQITGATAIVVTKLDLVPAGEREAVLARIAGLAGDRLVVEATQGAIPLGLIFDAQVAPRRPAENAWHSASGSSHPHDITSFSVQVRGSFDKRELKELLKSLPGTVLRAKGIVRLLGIAGHHACQLAGGRLSWAHCSADPDAWSTMVFVGRFSGAEEAALRARLAQAVRPDERPVPPVT